MARESFEQPAPNQREHFSFAEKQALEIELMQQAGNTDEEYTDWVTKYMDGFRELIEHEPGLHELYLTDRVACIEYIHKRLGIESPTHH
jgi:hypothetical protein